MAEKVFISYNHNDKVIVDTIARRLEIEFGRNNIFYDAWSMQPGDSIIGKMDSGLSEFTTFFFFVSPKSLESNMVKLEWQTALNRAVNNNLKFVAVRIADCSMPTILTDKLYIDLYGEGLDTAIEKMRCVIKGENAYAPLEEVQNINAVISQSEANNFEIKIEATYFVVHNPVFAIGLTVSKDYFEVTQISEGMVVSGEDLIETSSGHKFYTERFRLCRSLIPGQPFKAKLKLNEGIPPFTMGVFVMKEKTDAGYCVYDTVPCSQS